MHGMYVCTPPPSWLVATPWLVPILLRPLVKIRGSSPRRGSSPLLIVPTPEGWKAEYTLASRMQIHESLTVLALFTRGEARTSDPWICSLMLYHLSYLTTTTTTYIHTYINTYMHTYIHTYIGYIYQTSSALLTTNHPMCPYATKSVETFLLRHKKYSSRANKQNKTCITQCNPTLIQVQIQNILEIRNLVSVRYQKRETYET